MELTLGTLITQAGGTARCARACQVTPGAVSQWIKAGSLPLSDLQGGTNYAQVLIDLSGVNKDVWEVRLLGRKGQLKKAAS
ncbi:hypothetical protein [Vreelandella populi]|uniref:hypothetical protein n=1 Tax=Vreelandella populi TaxID=2498858 RepID=UPI000F8D430C|nr:hypothetical protein [Halomonas populi]RUR38513.1 hypothetical protein ELY25_09115 [Halomonas populi]